MLLHSSAGRYGADRQLALVAGGLDPARYRAVVVLPDEGPLADDLRGARTEVIVEPLAVLRRELVNPRGVAGLARRVAADRTRVAELVRERDAALVHSNTSVVLGGVLAARRASVPHVWHVREIYSSVGPWWSAYRRMLLSAAALPCVSEAARAQFGSNPRARVIGDGIAVTPRAAEPGERERARGRWRLEPDHFACAVLGRLSDWKGQDVLIRALAREPLRSVKAVALIAGEPWRGDERRRALEELARAEGVAERVRFTGFVTDPASVYAASDVVVVPSTRPDPLPNAALEAAAAGCCLVASDHGGLPEIVTDGHSGRLFAPGDHAALARVLAELARDPSERRRLGRAAAADVPRRYSAGLLLDRVQGLYDELVTR